MADFKFDDEERQPWEAIPEENENSYQAFTCYLKSSKPRTMAKAWRLYKKSRNLTSPHPHPSFQMWRHNFDWFNRALAYDQYKDKLRREVIERKIVEAQEKICDASIEVAQALLMAAIEGDATSPQVRAIIHALSIAGIQPVEKSHVTHAVDHDALDELLGLDGND